MSVDQPDTDVWVKLLDVAPDGTAYNLMSPGLDVMRASYRNRKPTRDLLEKNKVYRLELPTLLTANRFLAGHRVRIAIMTSFMPHMSRNLHTGYLEMVSDKSVKAKVTIHHSAGAAVADHPPRTEDRLALDVLRCLPDRAVQASGQLARMVPKDFELTQLLLLDVSQITRELQQVAQ